VVSRSAPAEQRKEREHRRKEKGPDGWGHPVSDSRKKEKERRQAGHCGRGLMGRRAGWAKR
jgi:hypothetical protein